jgi:CheY-like chemotaxis protein
MDHDRRPPDETGARRLNVLVADDEPMIRLVLSAMLRHIGHSPIEAEGGRQAVELAATEAIDLILLDMRMPDLGGAACARAIRSLAGSAGAVPIIGLTGDAVDDDQTRYLASGLDAIYSKPIGLDDLRRAIIAATAGSTEHRSHSTSRFSSA